MKSAPPEIAFSGVSQPCFLAYSAPVLIGSLSRAPTP